MKTDAKAIYLTQDPHAPAGAIQVDGTKDFSYITTDDVVFYGPVVLPGRTFTLIAGSISAADDSHGNHGLLSTSGAQPPPYTQPAITGPVGGPGTNANWQGQPSSRGGTGGPGASGAQGVTGGTGGAIKLTINSIVASDPPMAIFSDGGMGGVGQTGGLGGQGGKGGDGIGGGEEALPASPGGQGGQGGAAGPGGVGGDGGTILFSFSSLTTATLKVSNAKGLGGPPGTQGTGGPGGPPGQGDGGPPWGPQGGPGATASGGTAGDLGKLELTQVS